MKTVTLDLNQLFPGKPSPHSFPQQVAQHDFSRYAGQRVRLHGCAPTWAHLMIAARLLPVAAGVDFLIDDGKEGIVVPITS